MVFVDQFTSGLLTFNILHFKKKRREINLQISYLLQAVNRQEILSKNSDYQSHYISVAYEKAIFSKFSAIRFLS